MTPNLDRMSTDELWQFWFDCGINLMHQAQRLFPDKPKGYLLATKDMGSYAANLGMAHVCRERGEIEIALGYKAIAERIYQRLPSFANCSIAKTYALVW